MARHEELRMRCSEEELAVLRSLAEARRVPMSVVVREALEQYLATQKPASSPEDAPNPPTRREGTTRASRSPWRQGRHSVAPQHALRGRE